MLPASKNGRSVAAVSFENCCAFFCRYFQFRFRSPVSFFRRIFLPLSLTCETLNVISNSNRQGFFVPHSLSCAGTYFKAKLQTVVARTAGASSDHSPDVVPLFGTLKGAATARALSKLISPSSSPPPHPRRKKTRNAQNARHSAPPPTCPRVAPHHCHCCAHGPLSRIASSAPPVPPVSASS